jgi:hypothetical protein
MNLLKNNQTQHQIGCSAGKLTGCACVDPSYITPKLCDQFVLNKTTGFYCPPNNLNCSLCTGSESDEANCGYRFCRASNTNIGTNKSDGSYNTPDNSKDVGYYQNTFVSGLNKLQNSDVYKRGANGDSLTSLLGFDQSTIDNIKNPTDAQQQFSQYTTLQNLNFCAGTQPTTNNYDDQPIIPTGRLKFSSAGGGISPIYANFANWDSNGNFNFNT